MSAIGLDHDHIAEHFDDTGLCHCPCSECTTRTSHQCVCEQCRCDSDADHRAIGGILPEPFHLVEPDQVERLDRDRQAEVRLTPWQRDVLRASTTFSTTATGQRLPSDFVMLTAACEGFAMHVVPKNWWERIWSACFYAHRRARLSRMHSQYRRRHR